MAEIGGRPQTLLLRGLLEKSSLAVTQGLQVSRTIVESVTRIAGDTYRVGVRSGIQGPATIRAKINGRQVPPSTRRTIVAAGPSGALPAGGSVQLSIWDTHLTWPDFHFPDRVLIQWRAVLDSATGIEVDRYEIRDGSGNLLGRVSGVGNEYYSWQSGTLVDSADYQFNVTGHNDAVGATSAAATINVSAVTLPVDSPAGEIADNGDGTVTVT